MSIKKIWNKFIDILEIVVFIGGIIAALWITFGVLLYGGIVQIVAAASAVPVAGGALAIGILKVLFCEMGGAFIWVGLILAIIVDLLKIK